MAKRYKIFAGDVEFSYTSKELTDWRNHTLDERSELIDFVARMTDYPNREDACFYFDDPEELYWPKLTLKERENVRKAIEPHIIKVR